MPVEAKNNVPTTARRQTLLLYSCCIVCGWLASAEWRLCLFCSFSVCVLNLALTLFPLTDWRVEVYFSRFCSMPLQTLGQSGWVLPHSTKTKADFFMPPFEVTLYYFHSVFKRFLIIFILLTDWQSTSMTFVGVFNAFRMQTRSVTAN